MEKFEAVRPNKKAGNMVTGFTKKGSSKKVKTGNKVPNSKPKKKKEFTIPKFLQPEFIKTASDKLALAESGGIKDTSREGLISGNSFIVTSKNGAPKKPIHIFKKKSFMENVSHKKSMLFEAKHSDYVIAEAHRNYIDDESYGSFSLIIYQVTKDWNSEKNPKPFVLRPIFKFYRKLISSEEITQSLQKNIICSSNKEFMKFIEAEVTKKKLDFLLDAIGAAIDKSSERETTYYWFHGSKLADSERLRSLI